MRGVIGYNDIDFEACQHCVHSGVHGEIVGATCNKYDPDFSESEVICGEFIKIDEGTKKNIEGICPNCGNEIKEYDYNSKRLSLDPRYSFIDKVCPICYELIERQCHKERIEK